jgi:hypothetical protein
VTPSNAAVALVTAARAQGATVLETPGATVIVVNMAPTASLDELLPLPDAARVAATSVRVVREAIRSGALPALGRQRDRAVRRRDLESWIESRRSPVARVERGQEARIEARLRSRKAVTS